MLITSRELKYISCLLWNYWIYFACWNTTKSIRLICPPAKMFVTSEIDPAQFTKKLWSCKDKHWSLNLSSVKMIEVECCWWQKINSMSVLKKNYQDTRSVLLQEVCRIRETLHIHISINRLARKHICMSVMKSFVYNQIMHQASNSSTNT